jgi:hypothetical protein
VKDSSLGLKKKKALVVVGIVVGVFIERKKYSCYTKNGCVFP